MREANGSAVAAVVGDGDCLVRMRGGGRKVGWVGLMWLGLPIPLGAPIFLGPKETPASFLHLPGLYLPPRGVRTERRKEGTRNFHSV